MRKSAQGWARPIVHVTHVEHSVFLGFISTVNARGVKRQTLHFVSHVRYVLLDNISPRSALVVHLTWHVPIVQSHHVILEPG
jgi:hypothetical protein